MRIAIFIVVSFAFSWAIAYGLHRMGGLEGAGAFTGPVLFAYMFGPAAGAVTAALSFERDRFLEALGLRKLKLRSVAVWILYGWITPLILIVAATLAVLALTGSPPADAAAALADQLSAAGADIPLTPEQFLLLTLAVNLPIGIAINTVLITFNEELGWRGWLQPKLAGLGFWPMCVVIGVVWGLWHAPIVLMGHNYPGLGWTGVALFTGWTVLITPYLALARERGGGVWAAGAFHGSLNAAAGISMLYLPSAAWPWNGIIGAPGFVLLALGWPLIALYRSRRSCDSSASISSAN